jgi:hypothetical protein
MDMVNQIFFSYGHRYLYDFGQLEHAAALAGWTWASGCEVVRTNFRVSSLRTTNAERLAALDDQKHSTESLYAELWCML